MISKLTAISDSAYVITPVYTLKLPLFHLKFQKTDKFRFKPEVRWRGEISLVQANSEGSITIVELLKVLLLAMYHMKNNNFRFRPELRGRISKLMISLDSACLITPISTLKLLLVCLNPLKPVTSGLNRKCVGGSPI